jgi:hypothetical protein
LTEYLIELNVSPTDANTLALGAERLRRAAADLTHEGTPVRYLRTVFIPEYETCFLLYDAASAEAVGTAARRAGLPFERLTVTDPDTNQQETFPCR